MNKDHVKGTVDDAIGRTKRQVGEWTGDPNKQVEGAAQQVKGKAEKVLGDVKDAVRGKDTNAGGRDMDRNSGPMTPNWPVTDQRDQQVHRSR